MSIRIRAEQPTDVDAITQLTQEAFAHEPYSSHTEQFIVDALRRAGQLTVSLVAEEMGTILGHVAISPVTLSSGTAGWYGLGPISVSPDRQKQGIGSALMKAGLAALQALGGQGCVVLGDPAYYRQFGFRTDPQLILPGVPAAYFQAISFNEASFPAGIVSYHPAFEATE